MCTSLESHPLLSPFFLGFWGFFTASLRISDCCSLFGCLGIFGSKTITKKSDSKVCSGQNPDFLPINGRFRRRSGDHEIMSQGKLSWVPLAAWVPGPGLVPVHSLFPPRALDPQRRINITNDFILHINSCAHTWSVVQRRAISFVCVPVVWAPLVSALSYNRSTTYLSKDISIHVPIITQHLIVTNNSSNYDY